MKSNLSLSLADHRLLDLVWESEPIPSPQLCKLAEARLGWKRTTTYTVIKRLSERGVVKNENTVVSALVSQEEVQAAQVDEMMEKTFDGSLPAFIAAFSRNRKVSPEEIDQVQAMIDRFRRGEKL